MKFLSDILARAGLVVDGTVTLNSVANATTDTDKFLTIDSGVVKFRTGAQLLLDIGGQVAGSYVPTSRILTINGTAYDLSADRSWSITAGVSSVSAGTGISINSTTGAVTVTNTGLLSGLAGSGISVTTSSGALTITNTGILSALAGSGISVTTSSGTLTINNTGLLSGLAGSGISVTTSSGALTITNTGILSAVAGAGISVSTTSGTLTITNTITNNNQLTNGAGYITGYTETDTLATVTGRGATTSTQVILNGGLRMGNAYLNPSGDLNHFHFNGTAIIPNTTTTASNASMGTSAYRWSVVYGGGLDLSGSATISGSVTASSIIKSGGTSSQFLKADGSVDSTTYQSTSQKGQANGYASLDGAGKVPIAQLPSSIMEYKGTWNASTNSPSLADGTGDTGDVYRVSTAGTRNLGSGSITFDIGDYVIYNGTIWEKSDTRDAVASVNGLTGVITLTTTNIAEGTNLYYTDARARAAITLTTTGTSGAATYSGGVLNIPQYQSVLTNPVTGTGTTNYLTKFTGTTSIGNSQIFDNGTVVGIGATSAYIDSNDKFIVVGGRLAVNVGAFSPAAFNRSNGGTIVDLLIGGYGKGYIGSNGTDITLVSYANLLVTATSVGIGTASPSYKLQVVASSNQDGFFVSAADSTPFNAKIATFRYAANGNDINIEAQGGKAAIQARAGASTMDLLLNAAGGNVGVGTTAVAYKLQVAGGDIAIDYNRYLRGGGGGDWNLVNLYNGGTGDMEITMLNANWYLRHNANASFAGKVGIGVTNPASKLQIGSVGSSGYGGNDIVIGNGTQVMAFYQSSTISTWYTNTNFSLMPSGSGATGNLAVGISTPLYRVDIGGSLRLTGALVLDDATSNVIQHRAGTDVNTLVTVGHGGFDHNGYLRIGGANVATQSWVQSQGYITPNSTVSGWIAFQASTQGTTIIRAVQQDTTSGYYLFQGITGSTEVFRVDRFGSAYFASNVGIGTTSPTQLLHILGTNAANNGITIQNANASGNSQLRFLNTSGTERAAITYINSADAVYHYTTSGGNIFNLVGANVGVGTISPAYKLDVTGEIRSTQTVYSGGNFEMLGGWSNSPFTNSSWVRAASGAGIFLVNNAITSVAGLKSDGTFYVSGASTFASSITCVSLTETSTIKVKENIVSIDSALDQVEKLQAVSYNRKGSSVKEIGLIAEAVEEVYPEFVQYDQNGEPVGLNYSRLTAVLIESVKELKNRIQELEKRN